MQVQWRIVRFSITYIGRKSRNQETPPFDSGLGRHHTLWCSFFHYTSFPPLSNFHTDLKIAANICITLACSEVSNYRFSVSNLWWPDTDPVADGPHLHCMIPTNGCRRHLFDSGLGPSHSDSWFFSSPTRLLDHLSIPLKTNPLRWRVARICIPRKVFSVSVDPVEDGPHLHLFRSFGSGKTEAQLRMHTDLHSFVDSFRRM
ncbi:hypothetical protein B0H10DRAFT_808019 [Mycena sp. CBHHK59/15]|nr:hypothetical protein B0H10DRAFT_808019 [Mycena sp. CBHHK59/15]